MAELVTNNRIEEWNSLYTMGEPWAKATVQERIMAVNTAEGTWSVLRWLPGQNPFSNDTLKATLEPILAEHARYVVETKGSTLGIPRPIVGLLNRFISAGAGGLRQTIGTVASFPSDDGTPGGSGDDAYPWATEGNFDQIPANKLLNAPSGDGGGGGPFVVPPDSVGRPELTQQFEAEIDNRHTLLDDKVNTKLDKTILVLGSVNHTFDIGERFRNAAGHLYVVMGIPLTFNASNISANLGTGSIVRIDNVAAPTSQCNNQSITHTFSSECK